MSRDWTDDDIAKLKAMAQKFPTAKIAADLGRSIGATIVKAHELKLSLRVQARRKIGMRPELCRDGFSALMAAPR